MVTHLRAAGKTWHDHSLDEAQRMYQYAVNTADRCKEALEQTGLSPLVDTCTHISTSLSGITMTFDGNLETRRFIHQVAQHLDWDITWLAEGSTDDKGKDIAVERANWLHNTTVNGHGFTIQLSLKRPTKVGARLPSGCVIKEDLDVEIRHNVITCATH